MMVQSYQTHILSQLYYQIKYKDNIADYGPAFRILSEKNNSNIKMQVTEMSELQSNNKGILSN